MITKCACGEPIACGCVIYGQALIALTVASMRIMADSPIATRSFDIEAMALAIENSYLRRLER